MSVPFLKRRVLVTAATISLLFVTACAHTSDLPPAVPSAFDRAHGMIPAAGSPPAGPFHVMTGDYLTNSSVLSNLSRYTPYLTYAYAPTNYLGALQKLGVRTVYYTNPLNPICQSFSASTCTSGDYAAFNLLRFTYNSAVSRNCSGNIILGWYGNYPVYQLNVNASSAVAYLQATMDTLRAYVARQNGGNAGAASVYAVDDVVTNVIGTGATQCNQNASEWYAQVATDFSHVTGGPFFVNTLGFSTVAAVQQHIQAINSPNVTMADEESCYGGHGWSVSETGNYIADTTHHYTWLANEYGETHTIAMGKIFWCLNRLLGAGSSYPVWRLYTYASFLLGYDPNHAVYEVELSSPSNLKIFPEMMFVPEYPTYTATDVSGYLQSSGVYLRKFAYCYYRGTYQGPCAVAVNPSPTATVLTPSGYRRHVVLSGAGVLDGGTLTVSSGVPSTMSPVTAQILLP